MKTHSLLIKLAKKFPKKIAKKYHDYPGLQCGILKEDTNTILLCLDFDNEVLNFILENKLETEIDLIITHHPFIYGKLNKILQFDEIKANLYYKMLDLNIPIYSFHTNFDEGKDGMNDALAEKLELKHIKPLINDPMARGGELKETMSIEEFSKYAKNKLNVNYGLLIDKGNKNIKNVAIVGGGGWGSFHIAKNEGYDIFLSGDIPHHGRRSCVQLEFNYLDLPHEIEKIFMSQMHKILISFDSKLNIIEVDHEIEPKVI